MGASKNLLFENTCGFPRQKNDSFPFQEEKENRNADRFRGFLPVLWPERRLAGSGSEFFRSALIYFLLLLRFLAISAQLKPCRRPLIYVLFQMR